MRGPLPVYVEDPVRRLRMISEEMAGLKRSKQALGAEVISRFNDFAPPTLLAQASRINFSTRLFNLIVTNVPGPQIPLYVLGRELEEVFPVAFLPQNHALAVAIMSYNGKVGFGLLADYDSMEDVEAARRRASTTRWPSSRRPRRPPPRLRRCPHAERQPGYARVALLVLLFIVVPIAELYVIIQVGELIGVWPTLALLLADAILGSCCCATRAAAPGGASTQRSPSAASPAGGRRRPPDRDRRHPPARPRLPHRHLRRDLPDPADPGDRQAPAARLRRQALPVIGVRGMRASRPNGACNFKPSTTTTTPRPKRSTPTIRG